MEKITALIVCAFLGYNHEQYTAIAGTKVARNLAFRGIAISIGSIAFGFGVFAFSRALLQHNMLQALAFAMVCASILFLIELNNIQDILATGQINKKIVLTRVAVVGIMAISSVFAALFPMDDDIRAHQARAIGDSSHALESDSRFKSQLDAARAATSRASKDLEDEKGLLARLSDLNAKYANTIALARNEREGNVGADGEVRIEGCGPKCRGHQAEATRIDAERTAVSHHLSALAGASERLAQAQRNLDSLTTKISNEAAVINGGASSRLSSMFNLMFSSPVAMSIVAFYLLLSLLPEILALTALSKLGCFQATIDQLNNLENLATTRKIQRLRTQIREGKDHKLPMVEGSTQELDKQVPTDKQTEDEREAA